MMETEPGTVNNELRQDYIPTNNTLSFPALHLQSLALGSRWPRRMSLWVEDSLGRLLEEVALQQKPGK